MEWAIRSSSKMPITFSNLKKRGTNLDWFFFEEKTGFFCGGGVVLPEGAGELEAADQIVSGMKTGDDFEKSLKSGPFVFLVHQEIGHCCSAIRR